MKKYEKPAILFEVMSIADTTIASTQGCQECSGYAPSHGKPIGHEWIQGGNQWTCSSFKDPDSCD